MKREKSVLVISPSASVSGSVSMALAAMPGVNVTTERCSLTGMNGHAAEVASRFDVVLFQSDPADGNELDAVRALSQARRKGAILMAIADPDVPLSAARALTGAGVDEVLPIGAAVEIGAHVAGVGKTMGSSGPAGRVISVMPARGGIGATTLSVNLADHLSREKRRFAKAVPHSVGLVDLDLQFGSVGPMLDLPEKDILLSLVTDGGVPDQTFVAQAMQKATNGVSVLSAPEKFAPLDAIRPDQVAALIDGMRSLHEYVVVDLPHALVGWVEPVLMMSDRLLLVTDLSVPAIRQCRRLIDLIGSENPALSIEIVVARDRRPLLSGAAAREAEKALDRPLRHWIGDDRKAARLAADQGKPLSSAASGSNLNKGIAALAQSLRLSLPSFPSVTQ